VQTLCMATVLKDYTALSQRNELGAVMLAPVCYGNGAEGGGASRRDRLTGLLPAV